MSILDSLKSIINFEKGLNLTKAFSILSNNVINVTVVQANKKEAETLNIGSLPPEKRRQLLETLLAAEDGTMVAFPKTEDTFVDVRKYLSAPLPPSIDFFSDKIPSDDYQVLLRADYIRKKFLEGNTAEVHKLKMELSQVYGEKANIICNLCTAGYFDSFLHKKYEEMAVAPGFKKEDFIPEYLKLIRDFPVAIFVSGNMSSQDVEDKILDKIKLVEEAHLDYLNIHGIGKDNINTIEQVVKDIPGDKLSKFTLAGSTIEKGDETIVVHLRFIPKQ